MNSTDDMQEFLALRAESKNDSIKTCTKCLSRKPKSEFYLKGDVNKPENLKPRCKSCYQEDTKKFKQNSLWQQSAQYRQKHMVQHYMRKYGMSASEALALSKDRTGICEICRIVTKLVVDHDHGTGKMRGKLCQPCNALIGMAKDDQDILLSAVDYLGRHVDKQRVA